MIFKLVMPDTRAFLPAHPYMKHMTKTAVHDNAALSRFELDVEGQTAIACYRLAPGVITLAHTEVPVPLRNRGIASRLVHDVLEQVRARGLKVVPRCPFVRRYMAEHAEFQDLLAA
jgi:predicted GNAT family acetyltransferase